LRFPFAGAGASENKRFLNEFERGVADCRGIYVTSIFVELYGKDWAMFRECMFMRLSFAFRLGYVPNCILKINAVADGGFVL
jgi:hypothetical protein